MDRTNIVILILALLVVGYFVISRISKQGNWISQTELMSLKEEQSALLLDVRTPAEFSGGHIPGATNIPYDILPGPIANEDRERPIVVYCHRGSRSAIALKSLEGAGFTQIVNFGAVGRWKGELIHE